MVSGVQYLSLVMKPASLYIVFVTREKTNPPSHRKGGCQETSIYLESNCSASVEPFNAVVDEVPPVTTIETWSK